jgi:hypothetical protein
MRSGHQDRELGVPCLAIGPGGHGDPDRWAIEVTGLEEEVHVLKAKQRVSGIFGPLELPSVEVLKIDRLGSLSVADDAGLAGIGIEQDAGFFPITHHAARIDREEGRTRRLTLRPEQLLASGLDGARGRDPNPVEETQDDCEDQQERDFHAQLTGQICCRMLNEVRMS